MGLWSLLTMVVFAAETVVSPLADNNGFSSLMTQQPSVSFGTILSTITPTPAVLGTTTAGPTPTPTPVPTHRAAKARYTIALIGDSMIDTLGPDAPHLKTKLTSLFPGTSFTILNYGVGGTNIDYGLERLTGGYTYLGNTIPSLVSQKPDIVIIESFGYNPYSYDTGAIDKHWLQLAAMVDTLKANVPKVKIVIAATIAPNSSTFGDGAAGLSFSPQDKIQRTSTIKEYLASTVKFAASQHLPIADLYHASLTGNGDGNLTYINGGDHIHYSDAGRKLFAQKVTDAILAHHLLDE